MKTLNFILFYFAAIQISTAQCTVTGDLNFTTQAALDAWTPPCTQITVEGFVNVQGTGITDISKLSNIIQVNGFLQLRSLSLTSINAIQNITSVGDSFVLRDCDNLTALPTLNIASIGNNIDIRNNDVLTSISGFSNLTSLTEALYVRDNPVLTSLNGLQNISAPGGQIYIFNNAQLNNISALNYGPLNERLDIVNNVNLQNINGLSNITSITNGNLLLQGNTALSDISGLSNLTAINNGSLSIIDCPSLTNLNSLNNLTTVDLNIVITGNTTLNNFCGISGLIASTTYDNYTVSGNAYNPTVSNFPANCSSSLSTDSFDLTTDFKVYPTLVENELFINTDQSDINKITFYNTIGNEIKSISAKNTKELKINLSDFSSGIYFVKIDAANQSVTKKIIKK